LYQQPDVIIGNMEEKLVFFITVILIVLKETVYPWFVKISGEGRKIRKFREESRASLFFDLFLSRLDKTSL